MIYDWEKFKKTQIPWIIQGMKLTKIRLIIDNKVVKESYSIKELPHA